MNKNNDKIAIIGMSCRFPGANNYMEYWDNLVQNINSVTEIPADRWDWREYVGTPKWGGFIQDIDKFDPLFFKISPTEANYIDPQHRIFLEATWHAIEDAGYDPRSLAGKKIGVYVGVSKNDYAELMRENKVPIISFLSTGTVHSIIANRVSYLLDFHGKSEVVDTACSSFMVALNNAVRDIQLGLCESAVVGGVNAILTPTMYISHSKSGMLSDDGVCRSFDEKANGYVRGEGVGVIFLKPLKQAQQDGDPIWGIVRGISISHGGKSNFLTAPKASSQAAVISAALQDANVSPSSVSYIEAHGTGTPLGDPIEIEALKEAYPIKNRCGIGSVKTNIGHLESAAGVAGLIKILLSFRYKTIPQSLHFTKLNPYIKLEDSPFYIVEENTEWQHTPLRAGLSAFGMGGVNAHAILEESPIAPHPINLPGYAFQKMRCWFPQNSFKISDYFIRDHVVKDEHVVPGVKYLDVFLTEVEMRTSSKVKEIKDVF
ncbi:MAG: polyketide synthase, partial [Gammaproteobacteria bacterium]